MVSRHALALWGDESGATAIEYALIAAMIAFVVIVGLTAFGTAVSSLWSGIADTINGSLS